MSTEINEQTKEQESLHIESSKIDNNNHPKPRITEDIKNILDSLLKKTLDQRIIRLEKRNAEQDKNLTIIDKNFNNFQTQLKSIVKNMEETLKNKQAKKNIKNELPRRLKSNLSKGNLASKSVPAVKRLKNNHKSEYNKTRNNQDKKMNINNNYKTEEITEKQSQIKDKYVREKRIHNESNIIKNKNKNKNEKNNDNFPYKKDEKELIKSSTMSNFFKEKKSEAKGNINKMVINKGKTKDIKKGNLTKSFSEVNIKRKSQRAGKISAKDEKKEKSNEKDVIKKENLKKEQKKLKKENKKEEQKNNKNNELKKEDIKSEEKKDIKIKGKKIIEDKKGDKNISNKKIEETKFENKKNDIKDNKKKEENKDKKEMIKEQKKQESINQNELKTENKKLENNQKENLKSIEEENPIEKKDNSQVELPTKKEETYKNLEEKAQESNPLNNIISDKEQQKIEEIQLTLNKEEIKEEKKEKENEDKIINNNTNKEEVKKEENKEPKNTDLLIEEFKKNKIVSEKISKSYEIIPLDLSLKQFLNQSLNFSESFLLSKSMEVEVDSPKILPREPNALRTLDYIIKYYKYSFIYVLDFLNFNEKIQFTGILRGFKTERKYLFYMKREEVISCLELKDRETLQNRIILFKLRHSEKDINKPLGDFVASKSASKTVTLLDQDLYAKLFKTPVLDDDLSDIYILYRILFVLFGEHEIADIMDDRTFWIRCTEYLLTKSNGKIGTFILEKSKYFDFSHKSIYLMNRLLVGIKPKIIPTTFSKISGTTGLLFFLIKESLEYCGVLINDKKTPVSRIYDNLKYYENVINNLADFIKFLSRLK